MDRQQRRLRYCVLTDEPQDDTERVFVGLEGVELPAIAEEPFRSCGGADLTMLSELTASVVRQVIGPDEPSDVIRLVGDR